MLSKLKLNQLYFKDTSFVNLMTKRIFNVLLVAKYVNNIVLCNLFAIKKNFWVERFYHND